MANESHEPPTDFGEQLHDQLIMTALAFAPAVLTRPLEDERRRDQGKRVMLLRDSLIYRSDALSWHVSLISRLRIGATAHLRTLFGQDPNAPSDMLRRSAREQQYGFDDVVFNAIALFDYIGNLVAFSLYGEPYQRAKWKRVELYARKPEVEKKQAGGVRISGSEIGPAILRSHQNLYARLVEYRSELLHYLTDFAGGKVRTQLERNDSGSFDLSIDLGITAPVAFSKWCMVSGYEGRAKELPIEIAATWVCEETQRSATTVLKELETELRREARRDPDGEDRTIQML